MTENEEYPVNEQIEVLKGETIYKNDGWWKAVLASKSFGNEAVNVYLWKENDDGDWLRKQKYKVSSEQEWKKTDSIINELVEEYL